MHQGKTTAEINSQPVTWKQTLGIGADILPKHGERVAVVGCGTSWFIAQAYAEIRENAGHGETDATTATMTAMDRDYDHILAITRSGTTTEIIELTKAFTARKIPVTVITGVADTPVPRLATNAIVLDFADEESVVQTRFATSTLMLLRASLSSSAADLVAKVSADAEKAIAMELPQAWINATQITFLGTGWAWGLANEAALKLREAAQSWTEAYPSMEYRHGPIAIAEPGRLVWVFGTAPDGLAEQVAATGAELVTSELDPMAFLVVAQRLAVARAQAQGLNPDAPRSLTRSVILASG